MIECGGLRRDTHVPKFSWVAQCSLRRPGMLGGARGCLAARRLLSQTSHGRRAALVIVDLRRDDHRPEREGGNKWGRRHFSLKPDAVAHQAAEAVQSSSTELNTITSLPDGALDAAAVLGNWPSDYAIRLLEFLHQTSGLPYWETIIASTLFLRMILFPLVINTARGAARMTLMRPEMDALMEKAKANPTDKALQGRMSKELQGLYQKYQTHPTKLLMGPVANAAVFIPMFFGLKKMGEFVPGMADGGAFWFLDLGVPDPSYVLPCAAAVTFLGVTEIGMDGMKMQVTPAMKWVFRILPVGFLPLSADLPSACLLYWCSSNTFSMMQTLFMRNKAVKKWLMIPEVPEQAAGKAENPFKKLLGEYQDLKRDKAIADSEILYGKRPPPPPGSKPNTAVLTYAHPPPKSRKGSK